MDDDMIARDVDLAKKFIDRFRESRDNNDLPPDFHEQQRELLALKSTIVIMFGGSENNGAVQWLHLAIDTAWHLGYQTGKE